MQASPVPAGRQTGSPGPELDLSRMRMEDEGRDSPTRSCSPRRSLRGDADGEATEASDGGGKRARGGPISRASSLPAGSKKPIISPHSSPRLARRSSRGAGADGRSSANGSPTPRSPVPRTPPPGPDVGPGLEGVLMMEVEPAQFGRFRYEAEGRQNSLEGCDAGSVPTVRLARPLYLTPLPSLLHPPPPSLPPSPLTHSPSLPADILI